MAIPVDYDHGASLVFGGVTPQPDFDEARALIVPVPYEQTTSYVTGTRLGPREILAASGQVESWDDETATEPMAVGLYTLPELDLPHGDEAASLAAIRRVAAELADCDKFLRLPRRRTLDHAGDR